MHCRVVCQVFIQRAAVNLLSTVLDTPEFFWSAPDIMQTLYKRICEYMELDDRVEVLNNRFAVRTIHTIYTSAPQPSCPPLQACPSSQRNSHLAWWQASDTRAEHMVSFVSFWALKEQEEHAK